MTYVQYINCDKWKKVIGITLWIGASLGLGVLLDGAIQLYGTEKYGLYDCHEVFNAESKDAPYGSVNEQCTPEYGVEIACIVAASAINIANYFMIWRTLNQHYQWLKIICGEKPINREVKQ